ncbi:37S ribosomal protein MRP17, mitochondrial [Cytospora mali]|uniref:Small ribosomal subunit protein bS6m n=1 Tax=Cytospora mali TaxID=578113 RepID=A0A194VMK6_CYTMA|nr:37S ribosomal protein MRP17, mitochondrial [Valsa mali]
MLYEMIGIVRPGNLAEVKEIVLAAGQLVLRQGGVIRSVDNWGIFALPRTISKAQQLHHNGHYFCMRYDASTETQHAVKNTMSLDPRVIRSTSVKLGDNKLETLSKFGQVNWLNSAR